MLQSVYETTKGGAHMRILIAEDDTRLLKSLVHIFEMNHYAVDGVDNGNMRSILRPRMNMTVLC